MLRSPLLPIFLTVFVDVLGLTLVLPLLPYYAEHFGASPFVVGTLAASYALCQLISGPALGRISDRVGRKPTLLVSQMGTCVGFLTLGFADQLWMLFLGRIIDGLTAGNLSIAQAYISDVTLPDAEAAKTRSASAPRDGTPAERPVSHDRPSPGPARMSKLSRTQAFGLIGVAFGTGFLLGPAISGWLAHHFGYSAPVLGAAGLSFTSIILTSTMLPRVVPQPPAPGSPAARGRFEYLRTLFGRQGPRRRLLELFAFILAFSTLVGGLALFLERRFHFDVEKTGYVYAFSGFVGAAIQGGIIGRLVKRLGEERLALIGFVCMMLANGALGFADRLSFLLVLVVVSSFGSAVTRPALTTLLTKSVGTDEQGAALGVSQSLASIAQIIGPLTAGYLIETDQLHIYGLVIAIFAACGVVLSLMPGAATQHGATR
jgi:MFS family permease